VGSAYDDRITGDAAVNRLTGNAGMDTLDGGEGNDILVGGGGADRLIGNAGDADAADYMAATAAVAVNLVTGGTAGDATGDSYSGIEYVYGSAFDDAIAGNAAVNRLTGGAGNDSLDGAGGNDYLLGEAGDDVMTGGVGADVFVFKPNFGNDVIADFWAGAGRTDRLWLDGLGFTFADILAHATDTASGALLDFGAQGSITLQNILVASLVADDFIL
jgi:Ca2+-binding RTX toxin-like protein